MKKSVTLTFTGQAGFIIEADDGYRVGIDLYLSNCCERYFGFKRLMPYLYNPLELDLDLLIATHGHYDHFDPDSVPMIMSGGKTHLVAAYDVKPEAQRLGLDEDMITYVKEDDCFENNHISIKAMPCDHGAETPDAVGLLILIDGKKIYIAGDTAYREDYFINPELKDLDVMIMPINGAFGNVNECEGARAVNIIKPKLAIPCHYWNFAEHGGNPNVFAEEMKKNNNDNYILMRQGERVKI